MGAGMVRLRREAPAPQVLRVLEFLEGFLTDAQVLREQLD